MTAHLAEQVSDIESVDMIRALALSCPGVAAMSPTTRTYLPGRTVAGVTTDPQQVTVRVVAQYGTPLLAITERLGNLLFAMLAGRALQVYIDDIVLPGEPAPAENPPPPPTATPSVTAAPSVVVPAAVSPAAATPVVVTPVEVLPGVVGTGG